MLSHYDRVNTIDHQDTDNRFHSRSTDLELITAVSSDPIKPVWVTADMKQRTRGNPERIALADSGMSAVFFRSGFNSDIPTRLQAIKIITVWDSIVHQCKRTRVPYVFEVSAQISSDKVEPIHPTSELRWA